jgi:phage N-6-adenine-methyltransferase
MFSTGKDDWETPQDFFDKLDAEFHFMLDPCSTDNNTKCPWHYTKKDNGLIKSWKGATVFVNPPYSSKAQNLWIKKCYEESRKPLTKVVALLPARTDTIRFHDYIFGKAEIRFLRGRLKFEINGKPLLDKKGKPQTAPFPSMVVIWG